MVSQRVNETYKFLVVSFAIYYFPLEAYSLYYIYVSLFFYNLDLIVCNSKGQNFCLYVMHVSVYLMPMVIMIIDVPSRLKKHKYEKTIFKILIHHFFHRNVYILY